eukprot:5230642-Lingulodinium_polyedra.AAC.1
MEQQRSQKNNVHIARREENATLPPSTLRTQWFIASNTAIFNAHGAFALPRHRRQREIFNAYSLA